MIRTQRLLLRPWRDADRAPFAVLNADADVRRWFTTTLTAAESDASAARAQAHVDAHGFGFWAVEVPGEVPFAGFVGLQHVAPGMPFAPAIEIGWRLARRWWGRGFASEAALASLAHAFGPLRLDEVVAFAVPGNAPSRRVMDRIGMTHDPADDFDHPSIPTGSPLRRHVLYRAAWRSADRPQPVTTGARRSDGACP